MRPQQRQIHIAAEAAALLLVAPWLLVVASRPTTPDPTRRGLVALVGTTVLVDGLLLLQNLRATR